MLKYYIMIILFSPLVLFGDMSEKFSETFAQKLRLQNVKECSNLLDEWEVCEPHRLDTIQGLRACVVLLEGNIIQSIQMMEEALPNLEKKSLSPETADIIRNLYDKAMNFVFCDEELSSSQVSSRALMLLCRQTQLKGVKIKYWFGIAQIIAACVVAPFTPPAAGALALSGINITVQAAGEALDNMEQWEKALNRRQRIAPDDVYNFLDDIYKIPFCLHLV